MSGQSNQSTCPVCASSQVLEIIQINQIPVLANMLRKTRQEALHVERADMHVAYCQACGHLFNQAFHPEKLEYIDSYENSLHFSPRFQEYAESKSDDLIERYQLHNKDILEIGSGQGDFLKLLVSKGGNRGFGFDPSYPGGSTESQDQGITFIQDYYSDRYADCPADIIICRHVLEHIYQPREFLSMLRKVIGSRYQTVIFFEVPNSSYTLHELGIWDLIYEHYSYFSAVSLEELFWQCGFKVTRVHETFGGQFLTIEAQPRMIASARSKPQNAALEQLAQDVACFRENYLHKVMTWQTHLQHLQHSGARIVVWGSGSKGISFLNSIAAKDSIHYAVDINPRKQGMYISGSGQMIVAPEFLKTYQPDAVILMNPNYQREVETMLQGYGISAQVLLA